MTAIQKDSPGAGDVHVDGTDWKSKAPHARKPRDKSGAEITKSQAAPLYVYRQLLNGADLVKWAKAQGFKSVIDAADLHTTITYSKDPVDWMGMGESWSGDEKGHVTVNAGGPRVVERLGIEDKAVVLLFACDTFSWRNTVMREKGASWDWPSYQPHVTISFSADEIDVAKIEPYAGKLVFGPEIFEALKEDWADTIVEKGDDFSVRLDILKVDADQRRVFGWASIVEKDGVVVIDKQRHAIPADELENAAYDFVLNFGAQDDMHVGPQKGSCIESMVFTKDKQDALGIDLKKVGWWVGFQVEDEALWKAHREGRRPEFSIAGTAELEDAA